jgi:hypothetical protein
MTAEHNSIRFYSHKNIAIKKMRKKKKKKSNKNTKYNGVRLKMPTSPGLPTSNNWGWAETLKNSFTLVELDLLHKNGLSSISVTRVTIHSKRWVTTHSKQEVSDNTLKTRSEWQHTQERWTLQLKKNEHNSSKKFTSRPRRIKLGE